MFSFFLRGIITLRSFAQSATILNHLQGNSANRTDAYSNAFFNRFKEWKHPFDVLTGDAMSRVVGVLVMGVPKLIGTLVSFAFELKYLFANKRELAKVTLLEKYDHFQSKINSLLNENSSLLHVAERQALISDVPLDVRSKTWETFFNIESAKKFFTIYGAETAILTIYAMFGGVAFSTLALTMIPYAGSYMINDEKKTAADQSLNAKFLVLQSGHVVHPLNGIENVEKLEVAAWNKKLEAEALEVLVHTGGFDQLGRAEIRARYVEIKTHLAQAHNEVHTEYKRNVESYVNRVVEHDFIKSAPKLHETLSNCNVPAFMHNAKEILTGERDVHWQTKITMTAAVNANLEALSLR